MYLHQWWTPGTEGDPDLRSPLVHLRREFTRVRLLVDCGEALAACGEAFAEAGNGISPQGYPLVNKILETAPDLVTVCGEEQAACGEEQAACGNYLVLREGLRAYTVSHDRDTWPYFLYIGGETFGSLATIQQTRRDEFENLCLKLCPAQQWLGILVTYT